MENDNTVLLNPPLFALDKDAPLHYAGNINSEGWGRGREGRKNDQLPDIPHSCLKNIGKSKSKKLQLASNIKCSVYRRLLLLFAVLFPNGRAA